MLARMDAWNEVTAYGERPSASCPERIESEDGRCMDGQQLKTFLVAHTQSASPSRKHKVYFSGGDALRGHTRSHPEHDG